MALDHRLTHLQALLYEILALWADPVPEVHLSRADLFILLKGDVPANHVIEENSKRPDGGRGAVIAVQPDPLRRGVDSGA